MDLGSPLFSRGIGTFILPYLVINAYTSRLCVLFKRPIDIVVSPELM